MIPENIREIYFKEKKKHKKTTHALHYSSQLTENSIICPYNHEVFCPTLFFLLKLKTYLHIFESLIPFISIICTCTPFLSCVCEKFSIEPIFLMNNTSHKIIKLSQKMHYKIGLYRQHKLPDSHDSLGLPWVTK